MSDDDCPRPESDSDPYRLTRAPGTGWLTEYFAGIEDYARFGTREADGWFAGQAEPDAEAEPLTARKLAGYLNVPDELLMDAGVIPDTRPPQPPLPWRWRLRSKLGGWRDRTARRAFKVIAGHWPGEGDD